MSLHKAELYHSVWRHQEKHNLWPNFYNVMLNLHYLFDQDRKYQMLSNILTNVLMTVWIIFNCHVFLHIFCIQQVKWELNMSSGFKVNIFLKVMLTWYFHQMLVTTHLVWHMRRNQTIDDLLCVICGICGCSYFFFFMYLYTTAKNQYIVQLKI